jgi:hypothetical protein
MHRLANCPLDHGLRLSLGHHFNFTVRANAKADGLIT